MSLIGPQSAQRNAEKSECLVFSIPLRPSASSAVHS